MNKKGFIDFDDISPAMVLLPVVGLAIGFFTASGGFFGADFHPPFIYKLGAAIGGAVIGLAVAWYLDGG